MLHPTDIWTSPDQKMSGLKTEVLGWELCIYNSNISINNTGLHISKFNNLSTITSIYVAFLLFEKNYICSKGFGDFHLTVCHEIKHDMSLTRTFFKRMVHPDNVISEWWFKTFVTECSLVLVSQTMKFHCTPLQKAAYYLYVAVGFLYTIQRNRMLIFSPPGQYRIRNFAKLQTHESATWFQHTQSLLQSLINTHRHTHQT